MKKALVVVLWVALLVTSVGCGDDGGGSSDGAGSGAGGSGGSSGDACTKVSGCGGDIVGEWKVSASCAEPPDLKELCPTATVELTNTKVSGTASFKSDMNFSWSVTASANATLVFPADCLSSGGKMVTCQEVQDLLKVDPSAKNITCSSSDGGCKCENPYNSEDMTSGTYSVSGSTVMLTIGSNKGTADFCVKGGKLYLNATGGDSGLPSGQLTLSK